MLLAHGVERFVVGHVGSLGTESCGAVVGVSSAGMLAVLGRFRDQGVEVRGQVPAPSETTLVDEAEEPARFGKIAV